MTPSRSHWLLGLLLAAYAAALAGEAWQTGVTMDEPNELAEAFVYWHGRPASTIGDTPLLVRIAGGWLPRLCGVPLPRNIPPEFSRNSYYLGRRMLSDAGPAGARKLVWIGRAPLLLFPILTVWLAWRWARELFGDAIALILALALTLEPTLLAHGALLKSDAAAAFATLLFLHQAWRYWLRPGKAGALALTLALLLAVLAKQNLVLLVPVAILVFLFKGPRLAGTVLVLGTLYTGILAAYQFQVRRLQPQELQRVGEIRSPWFPGRAVTAVAGGLPWPPEFVLRFGRLWRYTTDDAREGYLTGRHTRGLEPWYFPLAWAVKFPIGLQILSLAGLVAVLARVVRRQAGAAEVFLCLPLALILGPAALSRMHQGIRHILPVFPCLILCAGFALRALAGRPLPRVLAAGCLFWAAVAAVRIYPQGLAYFNEWAGGPTNGWRYLADSNLDWGQNLPELARYLAAGDAPPTIQLYYWGMDVPENYLEPARLAVHLGPWPWSWNALPDQRLEPPPGVYAISVNNLLGLGFPEAYQEYFAWFRNRPPDGRAGYSIFVYRVP